MKQILPGSTIGLLGGGQLGRMLAIEGRKMGYNFICLDPTPGCPCAQIADEQIVASLDDLGAAQRLAERSDLIIYEFENINLGVVEYLENRYYLPQKSRILAISQDRREEKSQLLSAGFPVAPFAIIGSPQELDRGIQELGSPVILKTVTGGYDGKGQLIISSDQDLEKARTIIQRDSRPWVMEKKISFIGEISVIVARKQNGETAVYPVGENIHRNNVLFLTVVPARFSHQITADAGAMAVRIADKLEAVGLLVVEFFVTSEGLLVNELAPRPHNSGHYTLDCCYTSQFEQLIRAVCGLPLGTTGLLAPAVMVNILGGDLPAVMRKIPEFPANVKVHLYGKRNGSDFNRKMGHITIMTQQPEEAMNWVRILYSGA